MKEFLTGLYIEHGDRAFSFFGVSVITRQIAIKAVTKQYIAHTHYPQYTNENLPYKLTPKAIEFIKAGNE